MSERDRRRMLVDPGSASERVFREYTEFVIPIEQFKEAMMYVSSSSPTNGSSLSSQCSLGR